MRRPLYLIAALDDEIAAPEQTLACARLVGTPRAALQRGNAPGGHISPFRRGEIAGGGLAGGSGLAGGPYGEQAAITARRNMREWLQVDDSRDKCAKMALCPI